MLILKVLLGRYTPQGKRAEKIIFSASAKTIKTSCFFKIGDAFC